MTCNPLERNGTRNNVRPWWIAVETTKELEGCLKKLDRGVSRKRRHCATQQKAEVNKLELGNQLGRTWGEPAARVLRRYDESTLVGIAIDGESFCQNGITVHVHMVFVVKGVSGVNLARQT